MFTSKGPKCRISHTCTLMIRHLNQLHTQNPQFLQTLLLTTHVCKHILVSCTDTAHLISPIMEAGDTNGSQWKFNKMKTSATSTQMPWTGHIHRSYLLWKTVAYKMKKKKKDSMSICPYFQNVRNLFDPVRGFRRFCTALWRTGWVVHTSHSYAMVGLQGGHACDNTVTVGIN